MSEPVLDEPQLLRPASGSSADGAFLRNSVPMSGDDGMPAPRSPLPANRARTSAAFDSYMNQRSSGSQRTRLQELRRQHGWSFFRSKNSAGGRAYRDALKASKWRFLGGSRAMDLFDQRPDAEVAGRYRLSKQALKAGAGWRRFIPFTRARSDYKDAKQRLRTGNLSSDRQLTSWDRLMGTAAARRVLDASAGSRQRPAAPDADLQEVRGLLGAGTGAAGNASVGPLDEGKAVGQKGPQPGPSPHDDDSDQDSFADLLQEDGQQSAGGDQDPSQQQDSDDEDGEMRVESAIDAAANGQDGGAGISDFGRFIMNLMPQMGAEGDGERKKEEE